jgi:amino acid transporter
VIGLRAGKWTQNVLTSAKVVGVLAIVVVGLLVAPPESAATGPSIASGTWESLGFAMIFVLFTFGGWNEAAYVAGELRHSRRSMLWVLIASIALVTALYLAVNLSYLRALGVAGMANSKAVAAETVARAFGPGGAAVVSALVAVSALGAIDGCIFTGARAICAAGRDFPRLSGLGKWHHRFRTPANAVLLQSAIAAVLIYLPGMGKEMEDILGSDLEAAVSYTAPVFWMFLLLTGVSVFILRRKDPNRDRPFRVPLAPVTVGAFCLMCGYMLYRSVLYRTISPLIGLCVLLAGVPMYLVAGTKADA